MKLVTLRGGISVDWDVVTVLLDIENRGGSFVVEHESIRVLPPGTLSATDRAFLVAHKPEVLRILAYKADDSHLRTPV